MITCKIRYVLNENKIVEFEAYSRLWLDLIPRFGGVHHGYFLPYEGASDIAYALFSFDSLTLYERYRQASSEDPDCLSAFAYARETDCFLRHERSFLRPVLSRPDAGRK